MSNYCVYTLADPKNNAVRYAGIGQLPAFAVELWRDRAKVQSPLNDWLSSLDSMPKAEIIAQGLSLNQAEELLPVVRSRLKSANAGLLSLRPSDSFTTGGGKAIAIVVDGQLFHSVREAARSLSVSVATVSRRLNNPQDKEAYRANQDLAELLL